jgi:hypothetical protein
MDRPGYLVITVYARLGFGPLEKMALESLGRI